MKQKVPKCLFIEGNKLLFWTYRGVLSWEKSDNLALKLIILKLWGGLHLVGAIFGVAQTSSGKNMEFTE